MKFKFYFWNTLDINCGVNSWSFNFFPSIRVDYWADDGNKWSWFCILFSWLTFGFTLDWRNETDND